MNKYLLLAPLALLAVPMAAGSASADEVVIKRHTDNGLHRGWDHGRGHGARKVVIRREVGATGSTRVTKKVTRTNEFGDRVTKKVTREVD